MTLSFQGFFKTGDGKLGIIPLPVGTAPPAGTILFNGLARSPEGYLYVVLTA